MLSDIEVGNIWTDEEGNDYVVKDIKDTVVISESVAPIIDEEED